MTHNPNVSNGSPSGTDPLDNPEVATNSQAGANDSLAEKAALALMHSDPGSQAYTTARQILCDLRAQGDPYASQALDYFER